MNALAVGFDDVHALKCDLAAEVLRSSGSLRLRVMGLSMLPAVWPGDTLLIERVDANALSTGDLALFRRDRRLLVHRVVSVSGTGDMIKNGIIQTRGDAMPQPDPPVPGRDLLGRVSYIVRDGRLIEPKRSLGLPQRAVAGLMQRSETAARVAISLNGVLRSSRRQNSTRNSNQILNQTSSQRVFPCQS